LIFFAFRSEGGWNGAALGERARITEALAKRRERL